MPKTFSCSNSGDSDFLSYNYVEICIDPHVLNNFSNEEGLGAFLESSSCSEEFQKLRGELLEELMNIIENCLTDKQRAVMKMTFVEGMTQNCISSLILRHQTTVHKILHGNIDYNNNRRYGGALKKLKKLCANNKKIQEILSKMKELGESKEE